MPAATETLSDSLVPRIGISMIVFLLTHLTGDPVALMAPQSATKEDLEKYPFSFLLRKYSKQFVKEVLEQKLEDYEEDDENIIEFSGEKYSEGEVDDKYFVYIKKEYYEKNLKL